MKKNILAVALALTLTISTQTFSSEDMPKDSSEQARIAHRPSSSTGGLCFGLVFEESQAYGDFFEALNKAQPGASPDICRNAFFELLEKDEPLERFCTDENNFSRESLHNQRLVHALTSHLAGDGKRTGLRALGLPDFAWGAFFKNDAFCAAFKKNPPTELTFYGTGPLQEVAGMGGVKQLHFIWDSPRGFSASHAKIVASLPDLEVLTFDGRLFFDRVSSFEAPVSQLLADYIKTTKTLKALEISGLNRVVLGPSFMFGTIALSDRYTAFPKAPHGVSNYFIASQFCHLHDAILQNKSLTFLDLSTSAVQDLEISDTAPQITALYTHVTNNRTTDVKSSPTSSPIKELPPKVA